MTIKDILNTPISEMWSTISPFAIGYLIFFVLFFILVLSFIGYVFVQIFKGHKKFNKMKKNKRW